MTEIWDIYDSERHKTGKTMIRGTAFEDGALHLVVHLCIFNKKGQMLIQQRQKNKVGFPNLWDVSVGGSALAGETPQEAVMRECAEELGIGFDLKNQRPHFTINFDQGFDDTFLILVKDFDLQLLNLQEEEVQDAKWASREDILQMVDQGTFVPYHKSKMELCFDMVQV